MSHLSIQASYEIGARSEIVFPLLCPVRESEWIPGWEARVIHSDSGVAELDGVFSLDEAHGGALFVVTRYEPNQRVEFVILQTDYVQRLAITLEPTKTGTRLEWVRHFTGLRPAGDDWIRANVPDVARARVESLMELLARHLGVAYSASPAS